MDDALTSVEELENDPEDVKQKAIDKVHHALKEAKGGANLSLETKSQKILTVVVAVEDLVSRQAHQWDTEAADDRRLKR